jgi:hypothetical protein
MTWISSSACVHLRCQSEPHRVRNIAMLCPIPSDQMTQLELQRLRVLAAEHQAFVPNVNQGRVFVRQEIPMRRLLHCRVLPDFSVLEREANTPIELARVQFMLCLSSLQCNGGQVVRKPFGFCGIFLFEQCRRIHSGREHIRHKKLCGDGAVKPNRTSGSSLLSHTGHESGLAQPLELILAGVERPTEHIADLLQAAFGFDQDAEQLDAFGLEQQRRRFGILDHSLISSLLISSLPIPTARSWFHSH